ncbi:hypothetical protein H6F93_08980 [Leptolyngbya sp. FACHB-671]|nr:hypothetical protein [Leptolyngbya sp. FACHB-671]
MNREAVDIEEEEGKAGLTYLTIDPFLRHNRTERDAKLFLLWSNPITLP